MAEWLRSGLQSRSHRFDSGRRLLGEQDERLLSDLYEAFNRRDIDAVLEALRPDVDWTNALDRGRVVGREAVREYWQGQFTQFSPSVTPGPSAPPRTGASPSRSTRS